MLSYDSDSSLGLAGFSGSSSGSLIVDDVVFSQESREFSVETGGMVSEDY